MSKANNSLARNGLSPELWKVMAYPATKGVVFKPHQLASLSDSSRVEWSITDDNCRIVFHRATQTFTGETDVWNEAEETWDDGPPLTAEQILDVIVRNKLVFLN